MSDAGRKRLLRLAEMWRRLADCHDQLAREARARGDRRDAWRYSVKANAYRECAADLKADLEDACDGSLRGDGA